MKHFNGGASCKSLETSGLDARTAYFAGLRRREASNSF
jgi:hypothetical protein